MSKLLNDAGYMLDHMGDINGRLDTMRQLTTYMAEHNAHIAAFLHRLVDEDDLGGDVSVEVRKLAINLLLLQHMEQPDVS